MTRDVSLPVAAQPSLATLGDIAERAEALGYDRVWLPETWGRDAVTALTTIANRTDTIGVGTSVLPVYTRSPALLGQTAATLQEASDGRFRLGLGPSGQALIEAWHGISFERPLRRTRETIEIVKAVVRGQTLDYRGDVFTLGGFHLRFDPPSPPPSVDAAGMGPKAVELAGRFADGWHGLMLTRDGVRDRLADFERGVELGERDRSRLRTTIGVPSCVLDDGARARELASRSLAFYVGAMGTYYRESLARQGYRDLAHDVAAKWGSGEREAAAAAVTDDLLDRLSATGTAETAREGLAQFEAIDGVDAVMLSFPREADRSTIESTMTALAP